MKDSTITFRRRMLYYRALVFAAFILFTVYCSLFTSFLLAADAVEPATLSITNKREEATIQLTTGDNLWQGSTLLLTNCQIFADSAGAVTQGLDGVTVNVSAGNSTTNIDYTATAQVAASGTWYCFVTNLTVSIMQFQVKVTDGSGNVYVYAIKQKGCSATMF